MYNVLLKYIVTVNMTSEGVPVIHRLYNVVLVVHRAAQWGTSAAMVQLAVNLDVTSRS